MKKFYTLAAAVLLGLAISITVKLDALQSQLEKLTEEAIRNEWVNAARNAESAAAENNDSISAGNERN